MWDPENNTPLFHPESTITMGISSLKAANQRLTLLEGSQLALSNLDSNATSDIQQRPSGQVVGPVLVILGSLFSCLPQFPHLEIGADDT